MAAAADGSVQLGVRDGQVPEPRRARRVRRRVPRRRAVDRALEPRARPPTSSASRPGRSATRCSSRCASVRFSLAPNDVLPISFEWTFTGAVPPALENPSTTAAATGCASTPTSCATTRSAPRTGWVEVDGNRYELDDDDRRCPPATTRGACATMVGAPLDDVEEPRRRPACADHRDLVADPHGAARRHPLRLHTYYQRHGIGGWQRVELQGGIEHPDGRREPFAALVPELEVRDDNRRLSGGDAARSRWPTARARPVTVDRRSATPASTSAPACTSASTATGTASGAATLHVDGEHIADCTDPDDRAPHPPDPRQPRARRRPGRRRRRRRQPAEHLRRPASRDRAHRGGVASCDGLAVQRDLDELRAGLERWLGRAVGETRAADPGLLVRDAPRRRRARRPAPTGRRRHLPGLRPRAAGRGPAGGGAAGVPVAGPAATSPTRRSSACRSSRCPSSAADPGAVHTRPTLARRACPTTTSAATVWTSFLDDGRRRSTARRSAASACGPASTPSWLLVRVRATGRPTVRRPPALAESLELVPRRTGRPTSRPRLLWGDVRLGNVVFDRPACRPRAVLDWDMASRSARPRSTSRGSSRSRRVQVDLSGMTVPGFGARADAIAIVEARRSVAPLRRPRLVRDRSRSSAPVPSPPASPSSSSAPASGPCSSRPGPHPPRGDQAHRGVDPAMIGDDGHRLHS